MSGGDSSEDTESDYEPDYEDEPGYEDSSESSDGNGDDDDGGDSRDDDSVMISIPESTKLRERNSGISIREPKDSLILVSPSNKRKRDTVRIPAKIYKDAIVASSSSAANNVSAAVALDPAGISRRSHANDYVETITTTSSGPWNTPVGVPTRQAQAQSQSQPEMDDLVAVATIRRSNLQGPIFGSSSSSSSIQAQAEEIMAGLTRMAPHANAIQRLYGMREQPPSMQIPPNIPFGIPMRSPFPNARMAPPANAMQRPDGTREQPPLLQIPPNISFGIPMRSPFSRAQIVEMTRWCFSLLPMRGLNFVPGIDSTLVPSSQRNITRPSRLNPRRPNSVSRPIPSRVNPRRPNSVSRPIPSTSMSDVLGSSSVQAQAKAVRPASGLLPAAMLNYQQQQLLPSSLMGPPQHLRQQPPLLQDVRGLKLNPPANNEDADEKKDEEEDEGLDLNLRLGMNDEPTHE